MRVVDSVPNPWRQFMDGRLYEFTIEEYEAMPRYVVEEKATIRLQLWHVGERIYARFYDAQRLADVPDLSMFLAGWLTPNGMDPLPK